MFNATRNVDFSETPFYLPQSGDQWSKKDSGLSGREYLLISGRLSAKKKMNKWQADPLTVQSRFEAPTVINPSNSFSRVVELATIVRRSADDKFTARGHRPKEKIKATTAASATTVKQREFDDVSRNFESLLTVSVDRYNELRALVSRPVLDGQKKKMAFEEKTVGKVELKRELGLFSAVSIILAVMIGKTLIVDWESNFSRRRKT